ncbi:MAG: hypothetical protein JXA18_09935 [Chitinispirillaceae bacterium]|nr:hypothetical protein [Chitinispirillaceae bacterium]
MPNISIVNAVAAVMLIASPLFAGTFTVSKNGSSQFTSIQAAINAAGVGDEVVIKDDSVYEEQVTIDSTKNGLILRSEQPRAVSKPTIRFQDDINIGPTTADEALVDSLITYERNGALQILGAANVRIEGLAIDGGGVYPFGHDAIWEGRYPLQHGNAAITLWVSGNVIVRDCDIKNAYFGITFEDRNMGGIFCNPNPANIDPDNIIPFSGFARTGNHLIEYNRIHDNSVGMFFEYMWDVGLTIRYNLIYENHHPTAEVATQVKGITNEGNNQAGGAFMFKDHLLSPLAIHNNTLWHNSLPFLGNWKAGGQHLIFNNIYAEPNEYWNNSTTTFSTSFEMSKCFTNRMHHCVYAAQQQAPTPSYTTITNDLRPAQSAGTYQEGALVTPFPASAEIRWVETKFLSTDPSSAEFLFPDWSDEEVNRYIVDKGWMEAEMEDPDGSRADLGAIPMAGGRPVDVATIRPTTPVQVNGTAATIGFSISPRIGTIINPRIAMFGIVTRLDTLDVFGSSYKPITAANIQQIALPEQIIEPGSNIMEVTVPATTGDFGFFEMLIEGTGSNGLPFTTAAGFIPYRKLDYILDVVILDKAEGEQIDTVYIGETVVLNVQARKGDSAFTNTIDPTDVKLHSRLTLLDPVGEPVTAIPGGIPGTADVEVVFPRVPPEGVEHVLVAGRWIDVNRVVAFLGGSAPITVLPDLTAIHPVVNAPSLQPRSLLFELIDLRGRRVRRVVAGSSLASVCDNTTPLNLPQGIYLVRKIDIASGKVTMRKRVVLKR